MKTFFYILVALSICAQNLSAQSNFKQWALTPPMGWNSWDCYGPTVEEHEVKANADYMAEKLKNYGWEYVVIDIRWYVENCKVGINGKCAITNMWTGDNMGTFSDEFSVTLPAHASGLYRLTE